MTDYHVITPEAAELVMRVIDGQLFIVPPPITVRRTTFTWAFSKMPRHQYKVGRGKRKNIHFAPNYCGEHSVAVANSISINTRLKVNNFDLLRLAMALVVCLVHASQLSGFAGLAFLPNILSSDIAVKSFFVISGFLIFRSWEGSSSIRSYVEKRIRRIYPAYFTVIVLCAFLLFFISTKSSSEYFSTAWIKYLIVNLAFLNTLQPSLPGVFEHNILQAVDGALWTIKIEVMFYVAVPIIASCFRRFGKAVVIALVYLLSIAYTFTLSYLAARSGSHVYIELARQLPGQLQYFMVGAALYHFLPTFEKNVKALLTAAIAILVVDKFFPLPMLTPVAIGIVVIFAALFCYLGHFGKYGDFSYGVYILHFPIIQTLLASGEFSGHPFAFLLTAVVLALLGAVAMWNLVEKRFLHRASTVSHSAPASTTGAAVPAQSAPGR